jgi:hypothetical protein
MATADTFRPVPENTAHRTGYHAHYVRLGGACGRFTSFDPLGPGLAAGDGAAGGMVDHDHAAGRPSRREKELAAWLTRDVPPGLREAQFDIATLLAKIEQLRDVLWMAERNMIKAEHRAHEAERNSYAAQLAQLLAVSRLDAAALERRNEMLAAAVALCEREHCGRAAAMPAEMTIAVGEDTACARCERPLPAGSPAWPDGDVVLCADCASASNEGER